MRQTGIKYTCDRCGLECFVDFVKVDKDTRQYYESGKESRPKDWSYVHGCYLCPDCGRIYREKLLEVYRKGEGWTSRS